VGDQDSHPHKTTGKILIFAFYTANRKTKDSELHGSNHSTEFNLLLISSGTKFRFVTAVPKYLSFATFSKD
jgi:hypothetical protein